MRRFVRSFFIRRKAQVTVIQDGAQRQFEIWIWRAGDHSLTLLDRYPYAIGASDFVKAIAVQRALGVVADEKRCRQTAYVVKHKETGNYLLAGPIANWADDEEEATACDSMTAAMLLATETIGTDGWEVVQVTR